MDVQDGYKKNAYHVVGRLVVVWGAFNYSIGFLEGGEGGGAQAKREEAPSQLWDVFGLRSSVNKHTLELSRQHSFIIIIILNLTSEWHPHFYLMIRL